MAKIILHKITGFFRKIRDHADNFLNEKLSSVGRQKPAFQQVQENTMKFFHELNSPASTSNEEKNKEDS